MFDLDGRLVVKQPLPTTNGVEEMAVKQLPKGVYIWQLCHARQAVKSGKVIVQH